MSDGTPCTLLDSETGSLSSASPETLVYRTIRRSPRRFSPLAAARPARALTDAILPSERSEDDGNQGPSFGKATKPLRQQDSSVDVGQIDARTNNRQSQSKDATEGLKQLGNSKQQIAEAEKGLDEKEDELAFSRKNEEQYRNWWLNEIQFTKLLLNKIPNPNRDIELVRTSQAHYLGHY
ncbi:hypothetical protein BKA70DRAFT_1440389 [Coprinopsis sp. MPI-PUGE-AT-0042]|nr:hypothetical protein BKA70DRAFT_1440389 [Coprinopsis sp. MPI-PUGE-AT-0042]